MNTDQHEKLRHARTVAGYKSAAAAAEAFGWNVSTYRHHENGTRGFGADHARAYGRAFNVSPSWLLGIGGEPEPDAYEKVAAMLNEPERFTGEAGDLQRMMSELTGQVLLRHFTLSQFDDIVTDMPMYDPDNKGLSYKAVDRALIEQLANVEPSAICSVDVPDDSMSPTIKQGAFVLVDTAARELHAQDAVWLISIGGTAMIRRLLILQNDRVVIYADGRAGRQFEMDKIDLYVRGRVVWIGQSM
ncbi:S24 family peptidase [Sphingobium yanoikuyae]|jgi:phage repressor protein C with HTH and peptisase S24 domain|uniref:S24 family peptidase n=1 Tax=Sphingobium yanoikuyae TaxID=13690 RepID=UPI003B91E858